MTSRATPAAAPHVRRSTRARESQQTRIRTLAMSEDERDSLMWMRILSRAGLARFRPGELASDLGMTSDEAAVTLQRLREAGLITADSDDTQVDLVVPSLESATVRVC